MTPTWPLRPWPLVDVPALLQSRPVLWPPLRQLLQLPSEGGRAASPISSRAIDRGPDLARATTEETTSLAATLQYVILASLLILASSLSSLALPHFVWWDI
jgi:hypothetical protein